MADAASTAPAVPFFKKSKRPAGTARKRSPTSEENGNTPTSSEVIRPTQRTQPKLLSQGTKRSASQRETSDYDDVTAGMPDGSNVGVNWQGAGATREHADAKAVLDGEEAEEMMAQKRKKAKIDRGEVEDVEKNDGLYHGQDSYQHTLGRKDETALPKAQRIGPVKSTSTIRTVTMIDYQPDVCKDYKGLCRSLFVH